MTCIVGHIDRKNDRVVMGGDTAGVCTSNLTITGRKDVKVFKVGNFLIGCTSSFRMIQLIRFSFKPPHYGEDKDLFEYLCTEFIDGLRECFKKGGFAEKNNEVESGGTFLIAYKNRLFSIFNDYQVAEASDEFTACGCGESFAKGALQAINNITDIKLKVKVKKALEVAAYFSAGVRSPFIIETT